MLTAQCPHNFRFQYVAHQFDVLRNLSSESSIRKAIGELPVGLDATYDRLLQTIDPDVQPQVARSLMWLAFSLEVLKLNELAEVFVLRPDGTVAFDEAARLFKPRDVLKYFSGLVLAQHSSEPWKAMSSNRPVRLAHFSIKEYLISRRIARKSASRFGFNGTDAHLEIARSCVELHLQRTAPGGNGADTRDRFSLRGYAARNWPRHLEMVPRELWPTELASAAARALVARSQSLEKMFSLYNPGERILYPWDPKDPYGRSWVHRMVRRPLCFTARLGFAKLTEMLLSSDGYLTQEDLDMALAEAAYGGSTAVVDLLLDGAMPANIHAVSEVFGDALQAAASAGHVETAERLLSRGADIDARRGRFGSALQAACVTHRVDVVKLLVGRGANVNLPPWNGAVGVLTSAVQGRSLEILRVLLDSGADADTGGSTNNTNGAETALHAAARQFSRSPDYFYLLLERGADVNAGGGEYGYPLQALCSNIPTAANNPRAAVELLLDKGAEINARGGKYGSAFQCACLHDNMDDDDRSVVKFLSDRGANSNARGGYFGTPLQAACTNDRFRAIGQLLLEKGADVHTPGGYYGNALQASCHNGNVDAVEWLLDLGVDVNVSGGEYGNPLQAAAASTGPISDFERKRRKLRSLRDAYAPSENEGIEVLRRLLRRGANVNQQGGRYGTALQAAAVHGHADKVRLLLGHGADVHAEGGEYGTALQAACSCPNAEVALLLLEHGAGAHAQGGPFGSAWHAAAAQLGPKEGPVDDFWHIIALQLGSQGVAGIDPGWETVLQQMLDRGVDINDARGRQHPTALQAVLELPRSDSATKTRRVRFLLDRGADANIQAGQYGFPLQSACCCVREGTMGADSDLSSGPVEFLLLNCPDINVNAEGGIFGSALQAAAYHGQTTAAKALLRHGANVDMRGGKYRSALNAAVIQGFWDIVEVLLAAEATPDCRYLAKPDEEWLELVCEADGQGAVERYRIFWDKHKGLGPPRRPDLFVWLCSLVGVLIGVLWYSL